VPRMNFMVSIGPPAWQDAWDVDNLYVESPRDYNLALDFMQENKKSPDLVKEGDFLLGHFDVDCYSRWEREVREGLDDLGIRVEDVDNALMNAHLKLLASVFVDER